MNLSWQSDQMMNRHLKTITKSDLRSMGLVDEIKPLVEDFNELRESPPNIIIAKSTRDLKFMQNYFKTQTLHKGLSYVMGLGVYQQLHSDQYHNNIKILKPSNIKFKNVYKPYNGQDLNNKILLVFRTGGIGDLLFIQPNLIYLKNKYPTCKIKFACGPQYQSMVETWDCVDEVLDLPFNFSHLMTSDYHVLFEGVIERCKLAKTINAYNLFSEWMGLNLPDELLIPKQTPKKELVEFCLNKLQEWKVEPNKFILMQLRASSPIRTPNPIFWLNIINDLTDKGYNIVLTDSPRQADYVDKFIENCKNKHKIFNFCKFSESLDYSIAITSIAGLVVGTDSAMNHIAASLNVSCYGIYAPFPGYIRLKTYPKAKWIDGQRGCAPCFLHSQVLCNEAIDGFSPCYNNININKIIEDIEGMLND